MFKLEIEMGNDAMQSARDVAEALRAAALKIEREATEDGTFEGGMIRDFNGNYVGDWEIEA